MNRPDAGPHEHHGCGRRNNRATVLPFAERRHSGPSWEWQQVYVEDNRVEVLTLGDGASLLFFHGWGLSPRAYLPAPRALVARRRITAPSLLGVRPL